MEWKKRLWRSEESSKPGADKRRVDRQYFEFVFKENLKYEMYRVEEDGTLREFSCYEQILDATDPEERAEKITSFGLMALRAGYKQALGPIVISEVGYKEDKLDTPLTSVIFFLEKPPKKA